MVMYTFLEMVAEETKLSPNEILKDMQNIKRRQAHPIHCLLEMYWSYFDHIQIL